MIRTVRPGLALVLALGLVPAAAQEGGGDLAEGCRQSESPILRIEACTRLIEQSEEGDVNPSWAFTNRALAYEQTGRLDRALADHNTALLLDPDFALGYNNRGILHARMGNLDAAIADHARAVEIDPGYVDAWYNLGATFGDAGELEEAARAYDAALERDPDNLDALTNRAAVLCELGEVERSIEDRLRLLELGRFTAEELQIFLQDRGYYDAGIDGIFGRGSRAALREWTAAGCPRG